MAHKIVVLGNIHGSVATVFTKLKTLHAKQNFAFGIVAGSLFADPDHSIETDAAEVASLISGDVDVPFPIYFTVGPHRLPTPVVEKLEQNDGELCANLTALGRREAIKTVQGFRIVSLGGQYTSDGAAAASATPYDPVHCDADVEALMKETGEVDILLTAQWPKSVQRGAVEAYPLEDAPEGEVKVAELCASLKPRYHFSASAHYYVRGPFFHNEPAPRHVTQFYSMGPFGSEHKKSKWIFAFSLEPARPPPTELPAGCTASPLASSTSSSKKRKLDSQESAYDIFRFSQPSNGDGGHRTGRRGGKRHHARPPPTPGECFFCLSNPSCETHMICAIGNESYIATAKGPLTTSATFPSIGTFPGHLLIIPLQHTPTLSAISDEATRSGTVREMQRYRRALHNMLSSSSEDEKLGAVTWSVNRAGGIHTHWQFLPVAAGMVDKGIVKAAFEVESENLRYPKLSKRDVTFDKDGNEEEKPEQEAQDDHNSFIVWIWSSTSSQTQTELRLDLGEANDFRFDLQFGRRVMAKLLSLDSRADWRGCVQESGEESAEAEATKAAFKAFDDI